MAPLGKSLSGIHVPHHKNTMDKPTEAIPTPDTVLISMAQHIGAPCKPLVAKGDDVKVGQKIGDVDAFVSAPIHSSVSGKVVGVEKVMSIQGTMDPMVVIQTDKKQEVSEEVKPPTVNNKDEFIKAVRESGLVGLGGAAFPTSIKYNPKNLDEVDTFIVNGAECEPFITSDYRTMLEEAEDIIEGAALVMKYLDLPKCYIGIEDNKPVAIKKLQELAAKKEGMEIVTMKAVYPKGAEKVLIYETTGRVLGPGKLPADIGVIVSNITSISFLAKYFKTGMPLIEKKMTVDGDVIVEPKNVKAPIGTRIYEIVEYCGGYKDRPAKVLMGGPMMGRAIADDGKPILKNNNAILAFGPKFLDKQDRVETQCINCGKCVKSCPLSLMPTMLMKAYDKRDADKLKKLSVDICMECGCCSYVCPANKQLSLINKLGKAVVKEASASGK